MSNEEKIERLKGILREEDIPFFDEDSFVYKIVNSRFVNDIVSSSIKIS